MNISSNSIVYFAARFILINFTKSKFTIFMKTMPKPKKRNATERSQIRHVYAPILRLRKHQLPPFEMQLMTDAFYSTKMSIGH